jgi:mono/diheme cytochrome c family protein
VIQPILGEKPMKNILKLAWLMMFVAMAVMTWTGAAAADQGQDLFTNKCAPCHGDNGKGDGPMASNFSTHPGNFTDPNFWQGNVDQKITDTVNNGKGQMIPVDLSPDQIKAVINYIRKTFKK